MANPTKPGDVIRLVVTTCPDEGVGEAIVRALVEERLAACGNIVSGVRSIYWWGGRVEADGECLVLLKTRTERLDEMAQRLYELHPYDVPELLSLRVDRGAAAYLDWVVEETKGAS